MDAGVVLTAAGRRMSRNRILIAVVVVLAVSASTIVMSKMRSSPAIQGRILDAASGAPVPGAVVMASWVMVTPINAMPQRYVELQETRTDSAGSFRFNSWGPRWESGSLAADQPTIRAFHADYLPLTEYTTTAARSGDRLLSLRRAGGSTGEYAQIMKLFGAEIVAAFYVPPFQCEWRHVPMFLEALRQAAPTAKGEAGTSFLPVELTQEMNPGCPA